MKKFLLSAAVVAMTATYSFAQDEKELPEFPTEFEIESSSLNVTINQTHELDEDNGQTRVEITVTGTTSEDDLTLTFKLPEGFSNMIGGEMGVNAPEEPVRRKTYGMPTTDDESVKQMFSMFGVSDIKESTTVTFAADGVEHGGVYMLILKDDEGEAPEVDVMGAIMLSVTVEKKEGEEDPVVPETFTFTHDGGDGVTATFSPADEDEEMPAMIMVSGSANSSVVKFTIDIPEGWDGLYGTPMAPFGGGMGVNKRKAATVWVPISELEAEEENGKKIEGGVIEVPADGKQNMGSYMLYKGDMVDFANPLMIMSTLEEYKGSETGVSDISVEAGAARYFNLQGVEVSAPENGVFVKVSNGKATKVVK